MKFNGEYIEDLIAGYTTISVDGRETLGINHKTVDIDIRDGSIFRSKKYLSRTLTVSFVIEGTGREDLMPKIQQLNAILSVDTAEIIVDDEPDKYFTGTRIGSSQWGIAVGYSSGNAVVTGTFDIFCEDGFKYSIFEREAEPIPDNPGEFIIRYKGTTKCFPKLEAQFYNSQDTDSGGLTTDGECGYVGFFNENAAIIQLGDPDEKDGQDHPEWKSQTLTAQDFYTSGSWSAASSNWPKTGQGTVANIQSYIPDPPVSTSGRVMGWTLSQAASPGVWYAVDFYSSKRTETSVTITAYIYTELQYSGSWIGTGWGLVGRLTVGGQTKDVWLKPNGDYWSGTATHSASVSFTLSVNANTSSITGNYFQVYGTNGLDAGTLSRRAISNFAISRMDNPSESYSYYVGASGYGTGTGAHGPTITRTLSTGAEDFTLTYSQKMCIGNTAADVNQFGEFRMQCLNGSTTVVGVTITKNTAGSTGTLKMILNNNVVYSQSIDLAYRNSYFGAGNTKRVTTIIKSGSKVSFNVAGIVKEFTLATISTTKTLKVAFSFLQFGTNTALRFNGLYSSKMVKNNCDTWEDIPNKFSSGDKLEADCQTGKIYLNGIESPSLGALGNDWETFYLVPGDNQIGTSYSDWVNQDYKPTFKIKYREVYL